MKSYGVNYKGSKSRICDKLVGAIPFEGIDNFYDLFCGGCAVTHKMLLEDRYKHIHCNDLDGMALQLFINGIRGEYKDEKRWISREEFFRLKDKDPYVSCCWSFGSNQRDYIYAAKIEPYKKACHYAIVLDDFSLFDELCPEVADVCREALEGIVDTHERRILFGPAVVKWLKAHGTKEMLDGNPLYSSCHIKKDTKTRPKGTIRGLQSLESLESLQSLESLESLERLQRLQRLERLESSERLERVNNIQRTDTDRLTWGIGSYNEVEIKPNSVIYCDIPYYATDGYNSKRNKSSFDYEKFYSWCEAQTELVLISEYWMPEDKFVPVWETKHIQSLCASKTSAVVEKLFVPKGQFELYRSLVKGKNQTLFD